MKIALIGDCMPFGVCSSYRLTKDNKIKGVVGLKFKTLNRISISNELQKKHDVITFRNNARTTHIVENKKQLSTVEFILNNDLSDIIKYGFNYISFYEFLLKENKNIGRLFPDLHHPSMDCQIIMTDYIINNIEKIYEIYGK